MADTGFKFPTTSGDDIPGFGPGTADSFASPDNAFADDGVYATEANAGADQYESYGNFDFGVPAGATIDGIEVVIDGKETTDNVTLDIAIYDTTNTYRVKSQALTTSDATYTLGGAADLWSGTWDADEFTDANFKMYIKYNASAGTMSLDYIKIKVYYTASGVAYSIDATVGAFTLTGVNATVSKVLHVDVNQVSFTLTGIDTYLTKALNLLAAVATFTLTGSDIIVQKVLNMIASAGTFTLTGIDTLAEKALGLLVGTGQFVLTFLDAVLGGNHWNRQSKNSSSWTPGSKNSSSWTPESKDSNTWTPQNKN